MTKVLFIRHGQTDQNLDMFSGKPVKEIDYPLNNTGIEQVEKLRAQLIDTHIDIFVSSPMLRAVQTTDILNTERSSQVQIEDDLRERKAGGVTIEEWHELFNMDKNITPEGENCEAVREFYSRVYEVLNHVLIQHSGKTIAIVAHGGVFQAVNAYFGRVPWVGNLRTEVIGNAEVKEYEWNEEKGYEI